MVPDFIEILSLGLLLMTKRHSDSYHEIVHSSGHSFVAVGAGETLGENGVAELSPGQ